MELSLLLQLLLLLVPLLAVPLLPLLRRRLISTLF